MTPALKTGFLKKKKEEEKKKKKKNKKRKKKKKRKSYIKGLLPTYPTPAYGRTQDKVSATDGMRHRQHGAGMLSMQVCVEAALRRAAGSAVNTGCRHNPLG
jgi:hypothetical protein